MRLTIIIFSFVVFLVKGHIAKVDDQKSFSKLFDENLVNNYEKLFKVIKCQYCLTQKKGAQKEKCKHIMKECKHLLKDGKYLTMLKDLMSDLKVGNNEHVYGPNTEELKKIINFLELHKQEIKKIKNMIDTIKNNKAILLVNGGNNPMVHKLSKRMKSLKNNVEYIQKSQDAITKQLNQNDAEVSNILPGIFHLKGTTNKNANEPIQLGNVTENDEGHNYELGSLGVDEMVKNSMKGLFKDGEGLMEVVKNTLMQEGGGIGGELVSLIEKGKEIGEKIVDIEGMITKKDGTANADGTTIEKLDHFKTELSSYEFLITSLKGIVLSKLKDILLRLLYKAYIIYRTKKAKELGEDPPTEVPEDEYLSELKKGGLELGIKLLFNKLRYLLIVIKKKLFPKMFGHKEDKVKKEVKATPKKVTPGGPQLSSNMLRGSVSEEDVSLMTSIDNMIEEIDFYEKEIYNNPHTGGGIQGMDDDTEDDETDEEEVTEEIVGEVVDQITQEVADQITHGALENIAQDMVNIEAVVQHMSVDIAKIKAIVQEVTQAVEQVKQIIDQQKVSETEESTTDADQKEVSETEQNTAHVDQQEVSETEQNTAHVDQQEVSETEQNTAHVDQQEVSETEQNTTDADTKEVSETEPNTAHGDQQEVSETEQNTTDADTKEVSETEPNTAHGDQQEVSETEQNTTDADTKEVSETEPNTAHVDQQEVSETEQNTAHVDQQEVSETEQNTAHVDQQEVSETEQNTAHVDQQEVSETEPNTADLITS
uniref:Merozoite surface protein-9 n=1 Tax=Plasmodium coatneyi TaxID=208452 RepID=Q868I0_9APIC|nr:merozoite surface protein-9 [Plasmodium coatneyi]